MSDDRELVFLRHYIDRSSADLHRAHLASRGVDALVLDSSSAYSMLDMTSGGVRLAVEASDAVRARALLEELDQTFAEHIETDTEDTVELRCPACESEYVYFKRGTGADRLAPAKWRCRECDYAWTDKEDAEIRRTNLPAGEAKPVFILRRNNALIGGTIGFMIGLFGVLLIIGGAVPVGPAGLIVLPASVIAGVLFGQSSRELTCSDPGCRGPLSEQAEFCPKCRGKVHGEIDRAVEHGPRAAEIRREAARRASQRRKKKKRKPERARESD